MPVYAYRCPACHQRYSMARRIADYASTPTPSCPDCATPLKRSYDPPALATPFTPHFNPSLGRYVATPADLRSAASQLSDERSAAQGSEVRIALADPRDAARDLGVTTDGLESTLRTQYNSSRRVGRSHPTKGDQPTRWL